MNTSYTRLIESVLHQHNESFKQIKLQRIENKSDYDSIIISSPMTVYRPKIEGALFCRIKETGKQQYVSFRNKYKYWFDNKDIATWSINSDKEFFRITPLDFLHIINEHKDDFGQLAAQICIDAMCFPKFGCCSKYQQCSDIGHCIHDDTLYSSACEYRKNLESGKNFYKSVT